jgi:hypothetical protein
MTNLSLANSESLLGCLLLGHSNLLLVSSGDFTGLLGNMELDVTVAGEVWGDSTMGSVGSSSSFDGSLGEDVGDLAFLGIKTLGFGIGLNVLEESHNVFDRFLWESSIEEVHLFAHSFSGNTIVVSSEWNDRLVLKDSFHILDGCVQVETSTGSCSFVSVFVMCS